MVSPELLGPPRMENLSVPTFALPASSEVRLCRPDASWDYSGGSRGNSTTLWAYCAKSWGKEHRREMGRNERQKRLIRSLLSSSYQLGRKLFNCYIYLLRNVPQQQNPPAASSAGC